jgi:molybdopterin-guanine dinucleotide biosynthesis protein A
MTQTIAPPVFGLVLAGGKSTRMRQDKAKLDYHGKPQLRWAYDLVSEVCTATFISVRPDQREDPLRAAMPQIVDRHPGRGPIAGIDAALHAHPKAAWLVIACDLPQLNKATLLHLLQHRDPRRIATAYRSQHDNLPEPLCAIWEPSSRDAVQAALAANRDCPRKLLINSDAHLLDLPDVRALDNVNTPEEYESVATAMNPSSATRPAAIPRTIHVQYFAIFREQAGRSAEDLQTQAATPAALYAELQQRHPFRLAREQIKVAVNDEFANWDAVLSAGDRVVFIPPVAGG